MQPRLRSALRWAALLAVAATIGAPLGVWYALAQEAPAAAEAPLRAPLPLRPDDGGFTTLDPVLVWGGDAKGGAFALELAGDAAFAERVERHGTTENRFQRGEPFVPGVRVFWRVKAVTALGEDSGWSETRSFVPTALVALS